MATTKLILRTDKKSKNGVCPLYLRVTRHRKSHYVALGVRLKEQDWDEETARVKKSHRNSARMNAFIASKVADAEATIVEVETKKKQVTSRRLKEKILGIEPVDFFDYAQKYLSALESGHQVSTYLRASAVITKLKKFNQDKPLYLDEITVSLLEAFEQYLRSEYKNKPNTIHGNFRIIRKVINDAIRDGVISRDENPFLHYKLKEEKSKREYLLEEEVHALDALDLDHRPSLKLSRDLFVFACYAGGVRVSDLLTLRWRDISEGRLIIRMKKTGNMVTVKLPTRALEILDTMRSDHDTPDGFVFAYITSEHDIDTPAKLHYFVGKKTSLINKNLKEIATMAEISKKITFHVSRHSFATIALRKGIRIEYVSKLMGHADLKETQVYAKIINTELDKAMDKFNE